MRAHARVELPFVLRRSGTISGRVVDDDGVPLRDAIVSVYPEATDSLSPGTHTLERAATIGDRGTFSIGGLPPGVYRIRAEPPSEQRFLTKMADVWCRRGTRMERTRATRSLCRSTTMTWLASISCWRCGRPL